MRRRIIYLALVVWVSTLPACATLERLTTPEASPTEENLAAPPQLPASVQQVRAEDVKLPKPLSTPSEPQANANNQDLQIQRLEAQIAQQQKTILELQEQWTTNFSLMEQAVAETLRENQQLIAELQQSVEIAVYAQNSTSTPEIPVPPESQNLSSPAGKPSVPAPPAPPTPAKASRPAQVPDLPLVEEVSLAALSKKPAPPPPLKVPASSNSVAEAEESAPEPSLSVENEQAPAEEKATSSLNEENRVVTSPFEDPDLTEPSAPLVLQRRPGVKKVYNQGMAAFIQGDYPQAIRVFTGFVQEFPDDVDSDNAHYWIGYSLFKLGRWEEAETAFRQVLRRYEHRPTSQGFKTPDAIYMLGKLAENRNQRDRASYYFETVVDNYPGSAAANNAREDLERLL